MSLEETIGAFYSREEALDFLPTRWERLRHRWGLHTIVSVQSHGRDRIVFCFCGKMALAKNIEKLHFRLPIRQDRREFVEFLLEDKARAT